MIRSGLEYVHFGRILSNVGRDLSDLPLKFMADESNKASGGNGESSNDQSGSRNDVVVKIGLVGDAQVKQ